MQDQRPDHAEDDGRKSGDPVPQTGRDADRRERRKKEDRDRLPELHGERAGREEHAVVVLARDDRVRAGNIGDDGLRNDAEECHRESCAERDEHAAHNAGKPEEAGKRGDQEDERHAAEREHDQFLLLELLHQTVDRDVEADRKKRHADVEDRVVLLVKFHERRDEEGKTRLEHRDRDPVADV